MGGWGEPHKPPNDGAGTTGEIEDAHAALDSIGIPRRGSLADRTCVAIEKYKQMQVGNADLMVKIKELGG